MLLYPDHTPLPGTAPKGALIDFSIHGVEILAAESVQTNPAFARASANGRKPVSVPLELQCGARNLEEFNT